MESGLSDLMTDDSTPRREITPIREAEEGEEVCCICLHRFANTIFGPCMHQEFCGYCAFKVMDSTNKCPLCRTQIEHWDLLYPLAQDMSEEEKDMAFDLEFVSYSTQELQVEYVEAFGRTMEEALARVALAREDIEARRTGE